MRLKESTVANVVVPLDRTESSLAVIPVARGFAEIFGATPHIVYVGETSVDPGLALTRLGVQLQDIPGVVVDQLSGTAAEMIMHAARQLPRSLIVMCTHTQQVHGFDRFGSVTEAVLASEPDHIVLLPPGQMRQDWRIRQVLLAHDGTPKSEVATAAAAHIAQRTRAQVIALHVAAPQAAPPEEHGCFTAPQYVDQPQHEWPAWTAEFLNRMLAAGAPASSIQFKLVVSGGKPGSEVAQLARKHDVDLVVMACGSPWESSNHMAIRVVIKTGGCPVLLVHQRK
jgi:nucleotide-binding universal stress UspA family protein